VGSHEPIRLDARVVERVVARLHELEHSVVAIVVRGSHARGTAVAGSDLDISAIVDVVSAGGARWRTWFETMPDGRLLHVSAGTHSLAEWLAYRDRPAAWSLGFPGITVARYIWSTEEARTRLGDPPSNRHPAPPAELEEFIEAVSKVTRAAERNDSIALRWHARVEGLVAPGLLRTLNPDITVHDRIEAVRAALELPVAPAHWRADLPVVLGLEANADDQRVVRAARRLAGELLAFLRTSNPEVDDQPGLSGYLADGTLERYLGLA
jgi:phosphoribosyl-AMP cyclohydrolase